MGVHVGGSRRLEKTHTFRCEELHQDRGHRTEVLSSEQRLQHPLLASPSTASQTQSQPRNLSRNLTRNLVQEPTLELVESGLDLDITFTWSWTQLAVLMLILAGGTLQELWAGVGGGSFLESSRNGLEGLVPPKVPDGRPLCWGCRSDGVSGDSERRLSEDLISWSSAPSASRRSPSHLHARASVWAAGSRPARRSARVSIKVNDCFSPRFLSLWS